MKIFIYANYPSISNSVYLNLICGLPPEIKAGLGPSAGGKAKAAAYRMLSGALGFTPSISRNAYGKPFLSKEGDPQSAFFNISHSKTAVAVAVEDETGGEIGVDVEDFIPEQRLKSLKKAFSSKEMRRKDYAAKFWTLKESYLKCLGTGFSPPAPPPAKIDFSAYAPFQTFSSYDKYFFSMEFKGFHLSACAGKPFKPLMRMINEAELNSNNSF